MVFDVLPTFKYHHFSYENSIFCDSGLISIWIRMDPNWFRSLDSDPDLDPLRTLEINSWILSVETNSDPQHCFYFSFTVTYHSYFFKERVQSFSINEWGYPKPVTVYEEFFYNFLIQRSHSHHVSSTWYYLPYSVLDHGFGPPRSGSVSQRYWSGSGSGSFHHQAKIVRKTLNPTVLWLLYDFIFEEWCKCIFKK